MAKQRVIRVDLTQLKARLIASMPRKAEADQILEGLGAAAMYYWKTIAQKELRSSARDYVQALSHRKEGSKIIIQLRDDRNSLPGMIEEGWAGGDMRDWLLQSPKAKQGKNGRYLVIPFRHGTPGTGGRNAGPAMPGPIHGAAKNLIAQFSRPGNAVSTQGGIATVRGQRLHPGMPMKEAARKILNSKEKPWHSTSIYMSMIRKAQPTKSGPQTSGYQTFRTISTHSSEPGKHWVHPGIKARHFAAKVRKHIDVLATKIIAGTMK